MSEIKKLSDVFPECQPVLEVRDVQEAMDWYEEKLGFELDFAVDKPHRTPVLDVVSVEWALLRAFVLWLGTASETLQPTPGGWPFMSVM